MWKDVSLGQPNMERTEMGIFHSPPPSCPSCPWEVAKELNVDHSVVIQHLKQIGKVKSSISGCLMSWWQIKKILVLKCHLLLFYAATTNQFLMGNKTWIFTTTGNNQLSRVGPRSSSKALPNAKFARKKIGQGPLWAAALLIHYSFLNPGETIPSEKYAKQIDEMHWKLQRLKPTLANRKGRFFSTTVADHTCRNQCFKSWTSWAVKFCLICYILLTSCQPTTTSSNILTTFCRENNSITSRTEKALSKSLSDPKAWILMLQQ